MKKFLVVLFLIGILSISCKESIIFEGTLTGASFHAGWPDYWELTFAPNMKMVVKADLGLRNQIWKIGHVYQKNSWGNWKEKQ